MLGDEKKPECDNCKTLEITCYFGDEKPDWFDGGEKQKAEMERVKSDIRLKAGQRRDRKYMEMLDQDSREMGTHSHDGTPEQERQGTGDIAMSGASSADPDEGHSASHVEHSTPASSWSGASLPIRRPQPVAFWSDDTNDVDLTYIMIFLDSIFPYIFPYYHPFPLAGGKGWVLQSLIANRSVYHTCISLSTYFFAILCGNHEACAAAMVERLQGQIEMGLRELRREMDALSSRPPALANVEALTCMQSIVLMCHFEVATGNMDAWMLHLDAATTLLQQIVPAPENWGCVLESFDSGQFDILGLEKPFTAHQTALRFYAAQCLYMDVLSSITLSRVPRLHNYQRYLMPGCAQKEVNKLRTHNLFLDEYIGIHNGSLQALSDVAALDAWKKEQRRTGSLSIHELLAKAQTVGDALKFMLQELERVVAGGYATAAATFPQPFDMLRELQPQSPDDLPGHPVHNLIWLLAAQTYLHLVTSGWQPSCPEIARNVDRMTELFRTLPRGTALRSLALPFCLAGCLSGPEQECLYRNLVQGIGSLRAFGTVKDALAVMEAVWLKRSAIDESWDLSKCLNILGHSVLLI